jgi:2-polyprenyl-3-methyl-5-hydroxy-6-metoxy-1,4-benzoquinol methylase
MSLIHYEYCPVCSSRSIKPVLKAEDHTVTHEYFEIWECADCTLRFTQNVPEEHEIGKYYQSAAYISHTDTREGLINSIYHRVRNITLAQKKQLVGTHLGSATGSLLDIGAGTGAFARYMLDAGWQVTGLEPDADTRSRAAEINKVTLKPANDLFAFPAAGFDVITMWHVLEHVHRLHEYLEQIRKILKMNGRAYIAVPNYTGEDAAYYQQYWAAYDVPRHLYHFSPASMRKLTSEHGLEVLTTKPMWFDSFYVSMLSETYKTGASKNIMAFWQGINSNMAAMKNTERCSSLIYVLSRTN